MHLFTVTPGCCARERQMNADLPAPRTMGGEESKGRGGEQRDGIYNGMGFRGRTTRIIQPQYNTGIAICSFYYVIYISSHEAKSCFVFCTLLLLLLVSKIFASPCEAFFYLHIV